MSHRKTTKKSLTVAGLFAGIGGLEVGLKLAGHRTRLLCEVDRAAQRVLSARFPRTRLIGDIREVDSLPAVDLVTAGFPCQDLSQAGHTRGIKGDRSSLVEHVFRLLDDSASHPRWLLIENVPFMLQLDRGAAMEYLASSLEARGYRWAYRIVDTRSFGLPQRRRRVLLLASRSEDPRPILFGEDAGPVSPSPEDASAFGFYWTEGTRGLGWAIDCVPTLKSGSTIGIPSPPAIWMRDSGDFLKPDIRDAERLQGFEADWTKPAVGEGIRSSARWRLVGNAVSVPVAAWIGRRLLDRGEYDATNDEPCNPSSSWPIAAWGAEGVRAVAAVSEWPVCHPMTPIADFLAFPAAPLSKRATRGFRSRTMNSSLRFTRGFLEAIDEYLERFEPASLYEMAE